MTSKFWKIVGLGVTALGALISFTGNYIADKRQSIEMSEMLDEKLDERLGKESDSETAEKES